VVLLRLGILVFAMVLLYLVFGYVAHRTMRAKLDARLAAAPSAPHSRSGTIITVDAWARSCGRGCVGGYRDYAARHGGTRPALGWRQIWSLLESSEARARSGSSPLEPQRLAGRIRAALAIDELVAGLDGRMLAVAELTQTSLSGVVERRLLFGDPEVGTFEALLLLPEAPGPHPAIIGLHGHRDNADIFADQYMGRRLARSGFVVLMPTLRAHDCSVNESLISLDLLRHGATLMGLKVYETLLLVRYLDSLTEVEPDRIGILGHSGGASIADLVVRVSDRFTAKVTDLRIDYDNRCGLLGVHCETVPGLIPLTDAIDDEEHLEMSSLEVPYGFSEARWRNRIENFFLSALDQKR
jgi:hypothetical protein